MRKFLLTLAAASVIATAGLASQAQAQTVVIAPGFARIHYDGWRRHERWIAWHRHEEWLRWHHRGW